MGMVISHPKKDPPPRANRKNPERDTADRFRALPADAITKGEGGMVLVPRRFLLADYGKLEDLLDTLMTRVKVLEREHLVSRGYAAPIEKPDRPMTLAKTKEQSRAHIAVSQPGNEAEVLPTLDVTPVAKAETVLLLPAPSKMTLVSVPVQVAANEEIPLGPKATLLPAAVEEPLEDVAWLMKQFGWSYMEMFRVLDREYHRRNESALKIHRMTYSEIRIKRAIAKRGMAVPGLDVFFPTETTGFHDWVVYLVEASRLRHEAEVARKLAREVYTREMANTPEALSKRAERAVKKRKHDIIGRLDGAKFGHAVKFAMVDRLAHEPVLPRTSAAQLRGLGLMFRDGFDRMRRKLGWDIPDRGAKVREQAEQEGEAWQGLLDFFTERKPSDTLPNPANFVISQILNTPLDQVPMRELVRGYRQAGIGH